MNAKATDRMLEHEWCLFLSTSLFYKRAFPLSLSFLILFEHFGTPKPKTVVEKNARRKVGGRDREDFDARAQKKNSSEKTKTDTLLTSSSFSNNYGPFLLVRV